MKVFKNKIVLMFNILFFATISILNAQPATLEYSTFIGGSGWDYGHAIAVDDSGYAYIAGQANSSNYPTTVGAFDRTANGNSDILVTKLNENGSGLVYSTYIGGSGRDDTRKICLDKSGNVYLTGSTASSNFPLTNNSLTGNREGYFLKINSDGDSISYSSRWAGGEKLLLDSDGNLIILGSTTSTDFPTTEHAFCRTHSGDEDIFVAKINPANNEIIFSTLIGGIGSDWAPSMAIDKENNIIIAGRTNSENFPLKGNTYGTYTQGKYNIIVAKLKSDGTELLYSTIVGGSNDDWAFDVASDENNNTYITGGTGSNDFPVSAHAFDTTYNEGDDAFLIKLNPDGSRLIYSTYIGGSLKDGGRGVVVDKNGRTYLTGCTRSTNFPVSDDAYDKTFNGAGADTWAWGDPFLLVMNPEGTQVEYSTYFGGSSDEEVYGIAIDIKGDIYICGVTSSNNFPTTEGAYDRTKNGSTNIYAAKFQFNKSQIDYLGQTPPGNEPVVFAPGIVSINGRYEYGLSISPDGNEIFFTADTPGDGLCVIKKVKGQWSESQTANLRGNNSWEFEAFYSVDGQRLFFTSDTNNVSKFWFTNKTGSSWSSPEYLDSPVNNTPVMWCTFTSDGTMYYGNNNNWKIHRAKLIDGKYSAIENLYFNGTHPSVAADESYFLFNSSQYGGYGKNDILIVFKKADNTWTDPINLGNKINTSYGETCASLSPDGKYIFFSRYNEPEEKCNIYWVSSSVIDSLKKSITGIGKINIPPDRINLYQNYPNPFNPSTKINYRLAENSYVRLIIYDILGQVIKTLVNSFQNAGEYSMIWDATNINKDRVSSGVYLYSLMASGINLQKKMILM